MQTRAFPLLACLTALITALAGSGCDSPPSAADLPEWTPQDHDHAEEKSRVAAGEQVAGGGSKADGARTLIETTWRNQCASCHGLAGRGDGPSGPSLHATDLTQPQWQATVTDAQIAASITAGKGKMPRFDLPPNVVAGLVARVRASRGR